MFFANPELAKRAIQRRIEQSPADYVAYCAMCRDYFASRGKRTLHLLDLILGASADMQLHGKLHPIPNARRTAPASSSQS